MNDNINEIINVFLELIKTTKDLAISQFPLIIKQYITLCIIKHSIAIFGSLLFFIPSIIIIISFIKLKDKGNEEWRLFVPLIPLVISTISFIANLYYLLVVIFAPMAYLLDEFISKR